MADRGPPREETRRLVAAGGKTTDLGEQLDRATPRLTVTSVCLCTGACVLCKYQDCLVMQQTLG